MITIKEVGISQTQINVRSALGPEVRTQAAQRMGYIAEAEVKLRTPRDTGRLARSVHTAVTGPGKARVGPEASVTYAVYVERGTRPHFPPPNALRAWARRRGMNPYVVARAIAQHGTRPRWMFRDGAKAALPKMRQVRILR